MQTDTKGSLWWKSIFYILTLFFATFPFINYGSFLYGGTSTRSLNLVVLAGVLGLLIAGWLLTKRASLGVVKSPILAVLLAYLAVLTIAGLAGLNFSTTFWSAATRMTGIWYFLSLGIFMLAVWAVAADTKRHHQLILVIIVSAALYSVLDLLGKDGFGWLGGGSYEAFTFGNTTFAAMYLFGAFLLSIYYALQAPRRKWWMYALPVLIAISPNTLNPSVFTGDWSRGVLGAARATSYVMLLSLGALGGMWALAKLVKDTSFRLKVSYGIFAAGVLAAIVAGFSLVTPGGYLHEMYLERGGEARPLVWQLSLEAVSERPLLGWGGDNFERVFEQHFDNRLLEAAYGNEAWFDRAHNVIVDQAVDNGYLGLATYFLAYLVTIAALIYVLVRAPERRDRLFAAVLITYFSLHLLELQTAFDTSISYPMLAFMAVSAGILFERACHYGSWSLPKAARYATAALLAIFCLWSLVYGALPLARAQIANGMVREAGSSEKRLPHYAALFGSPVDEHAFLWRTATDFQRGIGETPSILENPERVEGLTRELALFEQMYRQYLAEDPQNFRAHLNLADVLIYQMLFGVDKLAEAQEVLDQAITLVPQSPLPYWMKAVAYLYQQKFALAREWAQKAVALNPEVKESQRIVSYIERSIKTFPDIDLYFFSQI